MMDKKAIALLICLTLGTVPLVTSAQVFAFPNQPPANQTFNISGIVDRIFLNFIWPIVVFISILMFIYAGVLFLTSGGNESKITRARTAMIWGIVGLAVVVLSFSLIFVVQNVIFGP